jgi:hypothetical protein
MPTSLPHDKVMSNQLSVYSSFLALQAQHASSGHDQCLHMDSSCVGNRQSGEHPDSPG